MRNKLSGTLNSHNALMVCAGSTISDSKHKRCLENLLFHNEDRIGCTVVPKQRVDLSQWLLFPKDLNFFPIFISDANVALRSPKIYLLLRARLQDYKRHESEIIQVENFGELIAWRAQEDFEMILKTDLNNLTKFVHCFFDHSIDINHELNLLHIETIDIEGNPSRITYNLRYPLEYRIKYSLAPVHWRKFADDLKSLYLKLSDNLCNKLEHPTITIESTPKTVPVSEVKPIKKSSEATKHHHKAVRKESKNKLEVSTIDSRRPKSNERKAKLEKTKHKTASVKRNDETEHVVRKQKPPKLAKCANSLTSSKTPVIDSCLSSETNGVMINSKPPNVLVYADSVVARDNVKNVLHTILNNHKYMVYDFPVSGSQQLWLNSTSLIVVCGNVAPEISNQFLEYLVNGGKLLCLCSDLLYSVLHIFSTAEVREHELVRFSYENWKRVKMMHHVFCYQASPAKRQFSKDSDQSNSSRGSSPVAPRMPSAVEIQHGGKKYVVQVQVLGAEETWHTPSLLLAAVKDTKGVAIFSQVHLEIDPTQYQDDESKFSALNESNTARLEILKHILSQHLSLDCSSIIDIGYSSAYFLGMHDVKQEMLMQCDAIKDGRLVNDKITVQFLGKEMEPEPATATYLPVLIHACPSNFSTVRYFEALNTTAVGRLVIYADVLTSSQLLLARKLRHGFTVIVKQQTEGVGRSGNRWLCPAGCAMFSLQLHVPMQSTLGRSLPLVQHLVMVAIVAAIKRKAGYEDIDLGLKWPNDLYANRNIKIGGLMISSSVFVDVAVVNVGCGINLDNLLPTTCINELIRLSNAEKKTELPPIAYEEFFAIIFNEIESVYNLVQGGDLDLLFELYYKYWLHSGSDVTVTDKDGVSSTASIIGIDEFGFLKVRLKDGSLTSVQPDGNSFDILKGLIVPKRF